MRSVLTISQHHRVDNMGLSLNPIENLRRNRHVKGYAANSFEAKNQSENERKMSTTETPPNGYHRTRPTPTPMRGVKAKRPRSAVTSGRYLFVDGNSNTAWSRRYYDLVAGHVADLGGTELLSEAQFSLIRRCAAIECELERLDGMLSRSEEIDLDAYARVSGHLRRIFETLHAPSSLERRAKDISPSLGDILREDQQRNGVRHAD